MSGKKNKHMRGVNDIPNRMNALGAKNSRAHHANQLARLEHQKALLEKQLQVWVKQQAITERRLRLVRIQIRAASQALKVAKSAPAAVARPVGGLGAPLCDGAKAHSGRRQNVEFTF